MRCREFVQPALLDSYQRRRCSVEAAPNLVPLQSVAVLLICLYKEIVLGSISGLLSLAFASTGNRTARC